MENFRFTHEGEEYWYSRSMAVSLFVFTLKNNELHVLANKRGSGTPDFQGCWNCICGYLDHNETLAEGAVREAKEEVGLTLHPFELTPMYLNSSPTENRQNITQRYMTFIPYERFTDDMFSTKDSENNEVDKIEWVSIKDVINNTSYVWAFGHDEIITSFMNEANTLANIFTYSSRPLHEKKLIGCIKENTIQEIDNESFVIEDFYHGAKYIGGHKVRLNNTDYLICNLSGKTLEDGDFTKGYVASKLKKYNTKIFII